MTIYLNNTAIDVNEGINLLTFLTDNELINNGGIAVAIDSIVIPKLNWKAKKLKNNDKLTLITATAGG